MSVFSADSIAVSKTGTLVSKSLLTLAAVALVFCCCLGRSMQVKFTQENAAAKILEVGANIDWSARVDDHIQFQQKRGEPTPYWMVPGDLTVTAVRFHGCQHPYLNEALASLTALGDLKQLALMNFKVPTEVLRSLPRLKELELLSLTDTGLSDADIIAFRRLECLEYLSISEPKITNASIDALAAITSLKQLDIRRTQITAVGANSLQKRLPHTRIYFNADQISGLK